MVGWKLDDVYKARKEAFVTGLPGGPGAEVIAAVATFPLAALASRSVLAFCAAAGGRPAEWSLPTRWVYEASTIVLPTLAGMTIAADEHTPLCASTLAMLAALAAVPLLLEVAARLVLGTPLLALPPLTRKTGTASSDLSTLSRVGLPLWDVSYRTRPGFLTAFRAGIMLMTCLAILAVDFPVFPRRFAKTETFGTSIMDIGVGAFVFAAALVSRQTRRGLPAPKGATSSAATTATTTDTFAGADASSTTTPLPPSRMASVGKRATTSRYARNTVADSPTCGSSAVEDVDPVSPAGARRRRGSVVRSRSRAQEQPSTPPVAAVAPTTAAPSASTPSLCGALVAAFTGLASTLLAVSPLVALGGVRFIVNSHRNHQEHVSEHGVHWSFFLSMAAVALLAATAETALGLGQAVGRAIAHCFGVRGPAGKLLALPPGGSAAAYLAAAAVVATAYQWLLDVPFVALPGPLASAAAAVLGRHGLVFRTLQQYIMYAPRFDGDFVSQNREGLASVFGFFALHLAGVGVGRLVLDPATRTTVSWRRRAGQLAAVSAGFWTALALVQTPAVGLAVSRRLVNLPYVLWVIGLCSGLLLAFMVIDALVGGAAPSGTVVVKKGAKGAPFTSHALLCGSVLAEAVNRNFLAVFLASNLLTGLVNMALPTLDTPAEPAMAVLTGYSFVVAGLALAAASAGLVLKVW